MNHRGTEAQRAREVYALREMKRVVAKAEAEGWVVQESRGQMTFLNRRTGHRVSGDGHADRRSALASACREMVRNGF